MGPILARAGASLGWVDVLLSALVLAVLGAPWPVPSPEVTIGAFSSDLITVSAEPGSASRSVDVTERALTLTAAPTAGPAVHLLTSEVDFAARFSATVVSREGEAVFPIQFKIWHPRAEVAVEAWYAPDGSVMAGMRAGDRWLQTRRLGAYAIGEAQAWRLIRQRDRVAMTVNVSERAMTFAVERAAFPALFATETLSLTVYATGNGGRAVGVVRDPVFTVPRQTFYGTRVHSRWFRPIVAVLAVASLFRLATKARGRGPSFTRGRTGAARSPAVVLLLLVAVAGAIGAYLSRFPGHPLDTRHAELWSLIGGKAGPANIVAHSLLATAKEAHGGLPYAAVTYPYPPLLTYLFWAAGQAGEAEAAGRVVKLLSLAAVAAGGVLLYALLLRLGAGLPAAAIAAGSYLVNPAVLFASAVWGQTDAFVAFFLLVASAGLVLGLPWLLWLGGLLALLTKQTGAIFAPMLLLAGVARFAPGRLLGGIPTALLAAFLALAPLFWTGVHPAATYRPLLTKVLQFGTVREMETVNAVVSQGSFTVWSVLTALDGARGVARMARPDADPSRLGLSYFALSRWAFALLTLGLGALLVLRRGKLTGGAVFVALAAYGAGMAVLLTRVHPRYLFFAVTLAAASWPWVGRWLAGGAQAILSLTMLGAMWGMLVFHSSLYPGGLPIFDPDRSSWNRLMGDLLVSDASITAAGLLNGAALLMLVAALVREVRGSTAR